MLQSLQTYPKSGETQVVGSFMLFLVGTGSTSELPLVVIGSLMNSCPFKLFLNVCLQALTGSLK